MIMVIIFYCKIKDTLGTSHFVLYGEVVLFFEVKMY